MQAYWEGELVDRVMLYIEAPREGMPRCTMPAPSAAQGCAADLERQINAQLDNVGSTCFGADALPSIAIDLGTTGFSQLLGAQVKITEHTSWSCPVIEGWEGPEGDLRIDWQGEAWRQLENMMAHAAAAARGKCLVRLPVLAHAFDTLADLRGTERLCLDLVDRPEVIQRAACRVTVLSLIAYETLWRMGKAYEVELTDMLPLWCPGRFAALQCDAMVTIGKTAFREFVLPDLEQWTNYCDRTIFHLDGKEALHHLDDLLAVEALDAIQFQQGNAWGVKSEPIAPFIPKLRRIQNAGKGVYLSVFPDELELVMRELSSRRLFIGTSAESEEEAREIEKLAVKWTHD